MLIDYLHNKCASKYFTNVPSHMIRSGQVMTNYGYAICLVGVSDTGETLQSKVILIISADNAEVISWPPRIGVESACKHLVLPCFTIRAVLEHFCELVTRLLALCQHV